MHDKYLRQVIHSCPEVPRPLDNMPVECIAIAAMSPDGVIGVNGKLPWHCPEDMKRFKEVTLGAIVIMGRKTWDSLPVKPLPGRDNIVITSSRVEVEGVECYGSIADALRDCEGKKKKVFIIGGGQLYKTSLSLCDSVDLTTVTTVPSKTKKERVVHFPKDGKWDDEWLLRLSENKKTGIGLGLRHEEYSRRQRMIPFSYR